MRIQAAFLSFVAATLPVRAALYADDAVRSLGSISACTCKFEFECSNAFCRLIDVDSARVVGEIAVNDDYIYAVYRLTWEEETIRFAVADRRQSETTFGGKIDVGEMSLDHIEDDFSDWGDQSLISDVVYFLLDEHGDVEAANQALDQYSRLIEASDPPHLVWNSCTCEVSEGFTEPSDGFQIDSIDELYRIASELPRPRRVIK